MIKKSTEYKAILSSLLVYYYQALINEGSNDPIRDIVTEFTNILEISKKQEMFIFNEIEDMDINIDDYINDMIDLTEIHINNPSGAKDDYFMSVKKGFELLKKQIVINNKKGA